MTWSSVTPLVSGLTPLEVAHHRSVITCFLAQQRMGVALRPDNDVTSVGKPDRSWRSDLAIRPSAQNLAHHPASQARDALSLKYNRAVWWGKTGRWAGGCGGRKGSAKQQGWSLHKIQAGRKVQGPRSWQGGNEMGRQGQTSQLTLQASRNPGIPKRKPEAKPSALENGNMQQ